MRSAEDVEAYLLRMHRPFAAQEEMPGTYVLSAKGPQPQIAVRVDAPLVVIRVNVGTIQRADCVPLLRALLAANATSLVHASFGLEGDVIVLSAALELENLDFNELEAVLDEMDVALAEHIPNLSELNR